MYGLLEPPRDAHDDAVAHRAFLVRFPFPPIPVLRAHRHPLPPLLPSSGVIIWGFAPVGVALNAARDVGGRLAALTLFGRAAAGGNYAALAALVNVPATLIAGVVYEVVFADSQRSECLFLRGGWFV